MTTLSSSLVPSSFSGGAPHYSPCKQNPALSFTTGPRVCILCGYVPACRAAEDTNSPNSTRSKNTAVIVGYLLLLEQVGYTLCPGDQILIWILYRWITGTRVGAQQPLKVSDLVSEPTVFVLPLWPNTVLCNLSLAQLQSEIGLREVENDSYDSRDAVSPVNSDEATINSAYLSAITGDYKRDLICIE